MPTLLIVDDNRSVRDALRFMLMRQGYEVLLAHNGPEGIALAAQSEVSGILIDVNMPGMSGIEACRLIRAAAQAAGRDQPVWMMTGARSAETERRSLEAGALALLGKPFDRADLFRRIEEKVGKGAASETKSPGAALSPSPAVTPPPTNPSDAVDRANEASSGASAR